MEAASGRFFRNPLIISLAFSVTENIFLSFLDLLAVRRILPKLTINPLLSNYFFNDRRPGRKDLFPPSLHLVAAIAILLDGKGLLSIEMTGATGFGRLHLLHGHPLVLCRGKVELDMAVAALVHARVKFVAEFDIPRILQLEIDILDRMTFGAFFRLERFFAVMTEAAGLPFFHLSHRYRLLRSHIVNLGVTRGAGISAQMLLVAEGDRSGLFDFDRDVPDLVALNAIIETEGSLAVVAGTTGFPLFHVRHGESGTDLGPEVKNGIVAGLAVVLDTLFFEMLGVVEYHLAEIGDVEGDIFDIDRISERAGKNRHGENQKQVPLLHIVAS
jgi:hypothetical protein